MQKYKIEIDEKERSFLVHACGVMTYRTSESIERSQNKNGRAKKGFSLALKDAKERNKIATRLEKFFIELKK